MSSDENKTTKKDDIRPELKDLVQKITAAFLVPPDEDELLSKFQEKTKAIRPQFSDIAEAFRSNIIGLLSTVSFPYALAHAASIDRHYQRIYSAERIRSLSLDEEDGESDPDLELQRIKNAQELSHKKLHEFIGSPKGKEIVIEDSLSFLERSLNESSLSESANELVLQGVVLCWGAFEVLARDSFIALLNHYPQLAELLLKDSVAKRRFEPAKVSLETLATHNFNLSGKMGIILAEQQDLSDLHSIKAVYEALFPADSCMRSVLADTDLRLLSQRRNLVVHRRGLIDDLYIKVTTCIQKEGEKLKISPDDLEKHIQTVISAALAILSAVTTLQNSTVGKDG